MEKNYGYVTFNDKEVLEGQYIKEVTLVFPTIEDSLKMSDFDDEKTITKVSFNQYEKVRDSEYYGYYNMKLAKNVTIEKIYSYEEVVDIVLSPSTNEFQLKKFFSSFKLKNSDVEKAKVVAPILSSYIDYTQSRHSKLLVKEYGKHSN